MFSQTAEYALRVIVYLASLHGKPATIRQISESTRTSEDYIAKVLRVLALAELVRSQRGPGGGSVLARSAAQITVYDVVQSIDPIERITTCPLGIEGHGIHLCPLHRRLDQAIAMVESAFRKTTIAELIPAAADSQPLCDVPSPRLAARVRS